MPQQGREMRLPRKLYATIFFLICSQGLLSSIKQSFSTSSLILRIMLRQERTKTQSIQQSFSALDSAQYECLKNVNQ